MILLRLAALSLSPTVKDGIVSHSPPGHKHGRHESLSRGLFTFSGEKQKSTLSRTYFMFNCYRKTPPTYAKAEALLEASALERKKETVDVELSRQALIVAHFSRVAMLLRKALKGLSLRRRGSGAEQASADVVDSGGLARLRADRRTARPIATAIECALVPVICGGPESCLPRGESTDFQFSADTSGSAVPRPPRSCIRRPAQDPGVSLLRRRSSSPASRRYRTA